MRILNPDSLFRQAQMSLEKLDRDQIKGLLGLKRWKEAEMGLPLSEYLRLSILLRASGIGCMKAFWQINRQAYQRAGGSFPSYPVFHKWMMRLEGVLRHLLDLTLGRLGQRLGLIDSMRLPIGSESRFIKSMGREAGIGHSSCGRYFGRKLHALIDEGGHLLAFDLTPASVHDLAPIKKGMLAGHKGLIYGDRGYLSQAVRFELMKEGIDFVARPKEGMGHATDWSFDYVRMFESKHKKRYRKRMGIERYFARLKRGWGLSILGLRSRRMADSVTLAALLASQWLALGLIETEKIV